MSKVTEMAREEAERVEAEATAQNGGEEAVATAPDAETEPETAGDPEGPLALIDAENGRHAEAIAEIMGDDFLLVHVCPGCQAFAAGFTFEPPEQVVAQLAAAAGLAVTPATPDYRDSDAYEMCEACNGYGDVRSMSKRLGNELTKCLSCDGFGSKMKRNSQAPSPVPVASQPIEPAVVQQLRDAGYLVVDPQPLTPAAAV